MSVVVLDHGSVALAPGGAASTYEDDDLYPVVVLIDELRSDLLLVRKNAIEQLPTIAIALGEERTREELVPFLASEVASSDDEDLILVALADQMADFLQYIGGVGYATYLIPILEELANKEEAVVRDRATSALQKIMEVLPGSGSHGGGAFADFSSLVHRLAAHDWFTSRISSLSLLPILLSRRSAGSGANSKQALEDEHEAALLAYSRLCKDDTPMVRRAAANHFTKLVEVVLGGSAEDRAHRGSTEESLIELMRTLGEDEQDAVRVLSIGNVCGLVGLMRDKEEQLLPLVVKVLQSCVEDKSWRVRYMLAEQSVSVLQKLFLQISAVLFASASQDAADAADDGDATLRFLRIVYVPLLTDEEAEVRCLALSKLPQLAQAVAKGAVGEDEAKSAGAFLLKVKPQLEKLAKDGNTGVRMSLAGSLLLLAPLVGAVTTASHLSALGLELMRDEHPEVRLKLIHTLPHLAEVIDVGQLRESLVPALKSLGKDSRDR